MLEENFRRALLLSRGDMEVFIQRTISAAFVGIFSLLVAVQIGFWLRRRLRQKEESAVTAGKPVPAGAAEVA